MEKGYRKGDAGIDTVTKKDGEVEKRHKVVAAGPSCFWYFVS